MDREPILVTGGTGTIGRLVVAALRDRGQPVRVASRGHRPADPLPDVDFVTADFDTGQGLGAALAGAPVVVHCAGGRTGDDNKARRLVDAARRAGTPHIVLVSVVGADRVPVRSRIDRAMFGYYASKRAAEEVVTTAGIPWTILRVTQVHELLLLTIRALTRLPIAPVPSGMRFQPIAAAEVAERLAELALAGPAGLMPDLGGPETALLSDFVRRYLAVTHRHRLLLPVPVAGGAGAALKAGANLTPERAVGHQTWGAFLTEQLGAAPGRVPAGR